MGGSPRTSTLAEVAGSSTTRFFTSWSLVLSEGTVGNRGGDAILQSHLPGPPGEQRFREAAGTQVAGPVGTLGLRTGTVLSQGFVFPLEIRGEGNFGLAVSGYSVKNSDFPSGSW